MINDLETNRYGQYEGSFDSSSWNKMDICIKSVNAVGYAEKCVAHFNSLSDDVMQKLCDALVRYCNRLRDFAEEVGDDEFPVPVITDSRDILGYINMHSLQIESPSDESIIGYSVEGSCKWEPEQGLQIVFRESDILYVGGYDGVSAWKSPEKYADEWNFA